MIPALQQIVSKNRVVDHQITAVGLFVCSQSGFDGYPEVAFALG